jgi:hypothetical protein
MIKSKILCLIIKDKISDSILRLNIGIRNAIQKQYVQKISKK